MQCVDGIPSVAVFEAVTSTTIEKYDRVSPGVWVEEVVHPYLTNYFDIDYQPVNGGMGIAIRVLSNTSLMYCSKNSSFYTGAPCYPVSTTTTTST